MEVKRHHLTPSHKFKESKIFYITHDDSHCIGRYIFINKDTDEHIILRHEYGHRIQSMILGLLYMLVIFIPSYLHFVRWTVCGYDWDDYYEFYTEKWADYLSKKK